MEKNDIDNHLGPLNEVIEWAQFTDMKTISVDMLLSWLIELKATEIEKFEIQKLEEESYGF